MAETVGRVCDVDGCGRPHRARGLCATHYNQAHQPYRHRKVVERCDQCGSECLKEPARRKRYGGVYCSLGCRDAAHPPAEAIIRARAARLGPRPAALRKLARAARGTAGARAWTAGPCHRCGQSFVGRGGGGRQARYCSRRCLWADKGRAKSGRRRIRRFEIFERDGWRCHLCGKPCSRTARPPELDAATVDHLVPQVAGGGDDPANLRTAHFICNSRRRDLGVVQLQLFG